MKKLLVVLFAIALVVPLVTCSGNSPVGPDPLATPSPTPAPTPDPVVVVVRAQATQGGPNNVVTGVSTGTDFKITGTMTACYQAGAKATCPIIPQWKQRQVGGWEANCIPYGSLNSQAETWNCYAESLGASFQVCAEDLNGNDLGCDTVSVQVG